MGFSYEFRWKKKLTSLIENDSIVECKKALLLILKKRWVSERESVNNKL